MSNFSAAFGYTFDIVPVKNSLITDFSAAPAFSGSQVASTAAITYSAGVISVDAVAEPMTDAGDFFRLTGLTAASLETETGSEEIYTYDDATNGFNQAVATTKSFEIALAGIADFGDAAYKTLRLVEQNTVADGLRVAFKRVGPTGTTEEITGYGTLTGFTESNEVSSIVSWECTLTGYGPYNLTLQS